MIASAKFCDLVDRTIYPFTFREFHPCVTNSFFCVGSGVKENIPITENVNVLIKPFRFTVLVGFRTTGEGFGRFPSPFHLLSIFCLTDPPKNRTLKSTCENWNWKLCVGQASVKNL